MVHEHDEPAVVVHVSAKGGQRLAAHDEAQVEVAEQRRQRARPEFPALRPWVVIRRAAATFREKVLGDLMLASGP